MNKIIIFLLSCLILLTSCSDYKEINTSAFISTIAIDKGDTTKFKVAVQLTSSTSDGTTNVMNYQSACDSIDQGFSLIGRQIPKSLSTTHVQIIIISKYVAESGITSALDFIIRDYHFSKSALTLISEEETAFDILRILTHIVEVPGTNIRNILLTSNKVDTGIRAIYLEEILRLLLRPTEQLTLPTIKIEKKEGATQEEIFDPDNINSPDPAGRLTLGTMALFNGERLAGYLDYTQASAYKLITGSYESVTHNFKCDINQLASVYIKSSKKSINVVYDGKLKIYVDYQLGGYLTEFGCPSPLFNAEDIKVIESLISLSLNNVIETGVKSVANTFSLDIFGFAHQLYIYMPNLYKNIEKDYPEIYGNLEIEVSTKFNLEKVGIIVGGLNE